MTPCIEFKGMIDDRGYGRIFGNHQFAHRISYHLHYGVDPGFGLVCHHCDNRKCINPEHLYLGTHQTNANDKVERNRCSRLKGESNPAATMTDEMAQSVINEPGTYREVARKFGLLPNAVRNVKLGITWPNLDRSEVKTSQVMSKLKPEQATAIRTDPRDAVTVAKEYGVSQGTILKIRNRVTFKYCP